MEVTRYGSWGRKWKLLTLLNFSLRNKDPRVIPTIVRDLLEGRCKTDMGFEFEVPKEGDNMIMVRILPKQTITMDRENALIRLKATKLDSGFNDRLSSRDWNNFVIIGYAGLAEILATIVQRSDVLLIRGGSLSKNGQGEQVLDLNFDPKVMSEIIRVPYCPALDNPRNKEIYLAEKIEAYHVEGWFKFKYFVMSGPPSNSRSVVVTRFRTFLIDHFCRNITDTLAFSKVKGEFPMPLVHEVDPYEIWQMLLSEKYTVPTPRKSVSSSSSSPLPSTSKSNKASNFRRRTIKESEDEDEDVNPENELMDDDWDDNHSMSTLKCTPPRHSIWSGGNRWWKPNGANYKFLIRELKVAGILLLHLFLVAIMLILAFYVCSKIQSRHIGNESCPRRENLWTPPPPDPLPQEELNYWYESVRATFRKGGTVNGWLVKSFKVFERFVLFLFRMFDENCNLKCILGYVGIKVE